MSVKIAIVGAGSAVFSINLIKDLCLSKKFAGSSITLMDIDKQRLDGIHNLCSRYLAELHEDIHLEKTMDREEALKGADFVIHVALDYGHERLRQGWEIAQKHGYRFGGSLHVMHDEAFWVNFHQVRLMESVYLDMQRLCPNAWMLMVANPVQMGVTYLCRKYPGAKIIGMCHGGYRAYDILKAMGYDRNECEFEVSGVNHFMWLNTMSCKGEDLFPKFEEWMESGKNMEYIKGLIAWRQVSPKLGPKPWDLYKRYGAFPIGDTASPGGGAWGWWYHTDEAAGKYMEDPNQWYKDHFQRSADKLAKIQACMDDPTMSVLEVFGAKPADEPMIPTLEGLAFGGDHKVFVNVLNEGNYVPGIPLDYQCECWAIVNRSGVHPLHMTPLPKPIIAQCYRDRIAPVEMEIAAFDSGNIRLLEQLVLMDPWTKSLEQAQALIKDILDMPCNADMKEYFSH